MSDFSMYKWLWYADKQTNEDEIGGEGSTIFQGTEAKEVVAKDEKTSVKNDEQKIITVKWNGKCCAQEKIKNKQTKLFRKMRWIIT